MTIEIAFFQVIKTASEHTWNYGGNKQTQTCRICFFSPNSHLSWRANLVMQRVFLCCKMKCIMPVYLMLVSVVFVSYLSAVYKVVAESLNASVYFWQVVYILFSVKHQLCGSAETISWWCLIISLTEGSPVAFHRHLVSTQINMHYAWEPFLPVEIQMCRFFIYIYVLYCLYSLCKKKKKAKTWCSFTSTGLVFNEGCDIGEVTLESFASCCGHDNSAAVLPPSLYSSFSFDGSILQLATGVIRRKKKRH